MKKVIEHPQVILASLKRITNTRNNGHRCQIEKEIIAIKRRLQTRDEREKRLVSLFEVDSITRDELLNRIERIKAERQEVEKRLTQLELTERQEPDLASVEEQLDEFCLKVKRRLDGCSFMNKRCALEILTVQIIATPQKVEIKLAVPLEFITIERTSA